MINNSGWRLQLRNNINDNNIGNNYGEYLQKFLDAFFHLALEHHNIMENLR